MHIHTHRQTQTQTHTHTHTPICRVYISRFTPQQSNFIFTPTHIFIPLLQRLMPNYNPFLFRLALALRHCLRPAKKNITKKKAGNTVTDVYYSLERRVEKSYWIPYLCRSFPAKKPYNWWLICAEWPASRPMSLCHLLPSITSFIEFLGKRNLIC